MKHPSLSSQVQKLISGYQRFKTQYFEERNCYEELIRNGQQPKTIVIACSDSRVDPAILTGCKPGELFVVRNVANLVPPYEADLRHHGTSAALEFAVLNLQVTDIVILGHSHCGGIRALMEHTAQNAAFSFITAWMDIAEPAKREVLKQHPHCCLDEQAHHCEKASLLVSLENLKTFPWINERIENQQLALHAWYFDLTTGVIESFEAESKIFIPLEGLLHEN